MLVCFGENTRRAVPASHSAHVPGGFTPHGVSAAFSLRAAMSEPVLQSWRSAGAARGLPLLVSHGRCVGNPLESKKTLCWGESRAHQDQNCPVEGKAPACRSPCCQGGCRGGLPAAPRRLSPEELMKD